MTKNLILNMKCEPKSFVDISIKKEESTAFGVYHDNITVFSLAISLPDLVKMIKVGGKIEGSSYF